MFIVKLVVVVIMQILLVSTITVQLQHNFEKHGYSLLLLFFIIPSSAVDGSTSIGDSKTMPAGVPSCQPLITSPTPTGGSSSTLTPGGSGISFNERFKPVRNGATAESLYSLATESGAEVKRQLYGTAGSSELPAGIPLSEALASKGLGNGASRAATMDSGFVYPMSGLSDYNFFSPRPPGVSDPQGIYSLAQQESHAKAMRSATLMPGAQLGQREAQQYGGGHRPLQETSSLGRSSLNPGIARGQQGQSPSNSTGPTVSSAVAMGARVGTETNRAELLENGYMAPRRIPRPSGYEYPPFGPPRPAGDTTLTGSSGTSTPTSRQPHSALLLKPEAEKISSPSSTAAAGGETGRSHTYINMHSLEKDAPPPIDRTTKPTPPVIDRALKPAGYQSPKNTPPEYDDDEEDDDGDSGSSDSSPEMSKKRVSSSSGVPFSIADLPKPTNRTTQYTQVEIVSATHRLKISSPAADDDDNSISRRAPIPVPRDRDRDRDHPIPKPRRVNYSDIDLTATAARVEAKTRSRSPTLRHAEQEHFKDTPYINVNREGEVDDDTDPDYYTHMRVSGKIIDCTFAVYPTFAASKLHCSLLLVHTCMCTCSQPL